MRAGMDALTGMGTFVYTSFLVLMVMAVCMTDAVAEQPDLQPGFKIQDGAGDLKVNLYSNATAVDWNNDGRKDVLCGDDVGRVWVLVNTGTNAAPEFAATSFASNGLIPIDVGYRAAPTVTDWDFDGKKDLLVTEMNGKVFFFKNTGSDTSPIFGSSEYLKVNGVQLDLGSM